MVMRKGWTGKEIGKMLQYWKAFPCLYTYSVIGMHHCSPINTCALGYNPAPLHGSDCSCSVCGAPQLPPVTADKPSLLFCGRTFLLSGSTGHPGWLHTLPVPAPCDVIVWLVAQSCLTLGSANPTEPGGGKNQDRGTEWQLLFKIPYSTSASVSCFSGGNFHI